MAIFNPLVAGVSGTQDIGGGYSTGGNLKDFADAVVDRDLTSGPDRFDDCCGGQATGTCITGDGTAGNPLTVLLDPIGGITCGSAGLSSTGNEFIFLNMGQAGTVFVDSAAVNQPRFIVPSGLSFMVQHAWVTAGIPSNSGSVDLEFYATASSGCLAPTPGSAYASISLPVNCARVEWTTLSGTINTLSHLQERVVSAGNLSAQDISVQIHYRLT